MTTERMAFGFNTGPGGVGVPRTFYTELDARGIPFFAMGQDSLPFDAQQIAAASAVPHTVAFRRTEINGARADTPNYDAPSPEAAADAHWAWHYAALPRDFDRRVTWLLTINEPRKEVEWADWVGRFMCRMATHALAAGVRYCDPGYSMGCPDPGAWETPGMLAYLAMCVEHPDRLGIALHEYSGRVGDIWYQRGDLVGRFEELFLVCDMHDIQRPKTLITEWGWTHNDAPPPVQAMADYLAVGELYTQYPEVLGAATWYLGPGYGGIKDKVKLYFAPLLQLTIDTQYPPPNPPPPTGRHKAIVVKMPQGASVGEWREIAEKAQPFQHTMTPSHDDMLTMLRGGNDQSFVKLAYPERQLDDIALIEAAGFSWCPLWEDEPPPPSDHLPIDPLSQRDGRWAGLTIGQPTGHGKTIGNWGCLLVCYNMMARYWNLSHLLPGDYNQFMVDRGAFDRQYVRPGALAIAHDGQVTNNGWLPREDGRMLPRIKQWIDDGTPVPAQVDFDPSTRPSFNPDVDFEQHWVLLIGYTADDFIMADPWHGDIALLSSRYGIPGTDVIQACFYTKESSPPPPPGQTYDLTSCFILPDGVDAGRFYVMHSLAGGWTQDMQLRRWGGGIVMVKGNTGEYWRLRGVDGRNWVQRDWDTSPGEIGGRRYYYRHSAGDQPWANWCLAQMAIGQEAISGKTVTRYWADNCQPIEPGAAVTDTITLTAVHHDWQSPANHAIVLPIVYELRWQHGEIYLLAPGFGYVGFGRNGIITEAIGELPQGRDPLPVVVPPCLT